MGAVPSLPAPRRSPLYRARVISMALGPMQFTGTYAELEAFCQAHGRTVTWFYTLDEPFPVHAIFHPPFEECVIRDTCSRCGDALPEGAQFCIECGQPVIATGGTIRLG